MHTLPEAINQTRKCPAPTPQFMRNGMTPRKTEDPTGAVPFCSLEPLPPKKNTGSFPTPPGLRLRFGSESTPPISRFLRVLSAGRRPGSSRGSPCRCPPWSRPSERPPKPIDPSIHRSQALRIPKASRRKRQAMQQKGPPDLRG